MNKKLENIIESLEDTAPYLIIPAISFLGGAVLGYVGKNIKQEWTPVVPPAMDFFWGTTPDFRRLVSYVMYGAGVAINYLPEINATLSHGHRLF